MDPESPLAPPVVAVVVVHDPGPWFSDTVDALGAQDYPNLRYLFIVAVDDATTMRSGDTDLAVIEQTIHDRIPAAYVRALDANPGFASAANEVLRLVEGDQGLFLIAHDDVAPDPGALRAMVEELYRSNAGAVGPKFVEWDAPNVLQSVGLGLDRFGEIAPVVEPGEVDQEQHDGVRDVFVVPSAFMLVRADLFRALGGFDTAIDFYGEDVELCWRIHHSGARVVVAPAARVRHMQALAERRPDLGHGARRARHRMRAVATLTGGARLPGRSVELVLLTLVELVVGIFTGRFAEAWNSLRALVGLVPRTPALLARRRHVHPIRRVPEREVYSLQERGSARLNSYLRSHDTATYVAQDVQVRRWRQSATTPVFAWLAVIAGVLVGGRSFIDHGVPPVGEFLTFPASPADLLRTFLSGWNPNGIGATSANPPGWAALAFGSVLTLFHMGLLQTVLVLGLVVVGVAGTWRVTAVFPSTRARLAALVVYAASPLVAGSMSAGRLTVLVVYATIPWVVHLVRRAAGIETADPSTAELDLTDGIVPLDLGERARRTLIAGVALGVAAGFAPVVVPVAVGVVVVFALGTLLAFASWRVAAWSAASGLVAAAVALVLNVPWVFSWSWSDLVGAAPMGEQGRGLGAIASFDIAGTALAPLSIAWYLPVLVALLLARSWRLTWAVRGGLLVVAFGALAVLADRGSLPLSMPEPGVVLVPVALGVALTAASAMAAFDLDVRGGSFGWRQPLGIVASIAVGAGMIPGVAALADGGFGAPRSPLVTLIDGVLPSNASGDYNVLLLGDARMLPVPATEYRDGVSWAIVDDGPFDAKDRWMAPPNGAADLVTTALDQIASGSTLRAGRLLAPLGIRYIVIPEFDEVVSTVDDPLPLATGLVESLGSQLDLVGTIPDTPALEVFENRAWLPTVAMLQGATAEASGSAGIEVLVRADLSAAEPLFIGADQLSAAIDAVQPGVVAMAVPIDDNWTLSVDGEPLESRPAFGETTGWDVPSAGTGELIYDSPASRFLWVLFSVVLWAAALLVAGRVRVPVSRRSALLVDDDAVIDLTLDHVAIPPDPGLTWTSDDPDAPEVES